MAWLEAQADQSPALAAAENRLMLEAQAYVNAWTGRQHMIAKETQKARGR